MRKAIFLAIFFLTFTFSVFARSGCCSSHGGVRADQCGCNDGTTLSAICAPYYQCNSGSTNTVEEETQPIYIAPTSTPYIPPPTLRPTSFPTRRPSPTRKPTPTNKPTLRPTKTKVNRPKKVVKKVVEKKNFFQRLFDR
jgi:hypothetical protein